eukprot:382539-Rhodomonas_salina.1
MEANLLGPEEDCENSPREGCLFPCTCDGIGKCPLHSDTNDRFVEDTQIPPTYEKGYLEAPEPFGEPSLDNVAHVTEEPLEHPITEHEEATSNRSKKRKTLDERLPLPPLLKEVEETLDEICSHGLLHRCNGTKQGTKDEHFFVVEMENKLEGDLSKEKALELSDELRGLVKKLRGYASPSIPTKVLPPELDPGKDPGERKRVRAKIARNNEFFTDLYHRDKSKLQDSLDEALDVLSVMISK